MFVLLEQQRDGMIGDFVMSNTPSEAAIQENSWDDHACTKTSSMPVQGWTMIKTIRALIKLIIEGIFHSKDVYDDPSDLN